MVCILKFTKRHYSVKSVDGIMVLDLCTLFDNALYFYQVLPKYLQVFQSYRLNIRVNARVVSNVARRTNGQKTWSLYHTKAGATLTYQS